MSFSNQQPSSPIIISGQDYTSKPTTPVQETARPRKRVRFSISPVHEISNPFPPTKTNSSLLEPMDIDPVEERHVLFYDVRSDKKPSGQEGFDYKLSTYEPSYDTLTYYQEWHRAEELSGKPVANAPPYHTDLPWDEMEDITIEELIVYFPNHMMRWPGLAYMLRNVGWDRLFERVAWLINVGRRSEQYPRTHRHVEPFPIMMKVQRAVEEIIPNYLVCDHDVRFSDYVKDVLVNNFYRKCHPRSMQGCSRTVSLLELASYVDPHLLAHNPFSRRVAALYEDYMSNKNTDSKGKSTNDTHSVRRQSDRSNSRSSSSDSQREDLSPKQQKLYQNSLILVPEYNTISDNGFSNICQSGNDCPDIDCSKMHPPDKNFPHAQPVDPKPNQPSSRSLPTCRFDPKCKNDQCRFEHPSRNGQRNNGNNTHQSKSQYQSNQSHGRKCKFDPNCKNGNCTYSHPLHEALNKMDKGANRRADKYESGGKWKNDNHNSSKNDDLSNNGRNKYNKGNNGRNLGRNRCNNSNNGSKVGVSHGQNGSSGGSNGGNNHRNNQNGGGGNRRNDGGNKGKKPDYH
ncbi:hypothetical protein B0J11DRAFT_604192 [Dendryphion nanum]|uniref:C3H1-type domain-containing protein n=1 Tax=Dendryphion nanum TaxID=256645 RepID=A0A9P9IRT7_9PLEO|nr:hypothetical protein B0J11DRAFT_604192 [Dendryphion nanum]